MTPPIIEFKGLSKRFGGVQALQQVSFAIPRGQIHALVGENGAGKSTLIRICGGVHQPDEGHILFDGAEVTIRNPMEARDIGVSVVHQEIPMCPDLTAAQNVFLGNTLPRRGSLIQWNEINRKTAELFSRLQVDLDPTVEVGCLPISHQQVVAIAKALSYNAKLIIMDEPTSALSRQETMHLFDVIRQLKNQGITIVYVSHRLEEVFEIADAISVLRDGRFVATVETATTNPDDIVQLMVGHEVTEFFPKTVQPHTPAPLLSVKDLAVPGVFEPISFNLHGGEVLGFVGLQGSGTSEILRALFGQFRGLTGEIRVRGKNVQIRSAVDAIRQGLAYIPANRQSEGLFKDFSVCDNAGLLSISRISNKFQWVPRDKLAQLAHSAVEKFNIVTASVNSNIHNLSGGNQQKVVLARSLLTEPIVILLDDPTRGVDVGAKSEIHQLLNVLTAQGCAVLLVSSELPEVLAMSDRIIVMYRGRVRAHMNRGEADREFITSLMTGVGLSPEELAVKVECD